MEHFHQAIAILRSAGHRPGEAAALDRLGTAYRKLGRFSEALEVYRESLRINRESGHLRDIAHTMANLGWLLTAWDRTEEARATLQEALSMSDERGEPLDGYLRLHHIYALDLPADLVVLSACRTALGKHVRGDGLVGLTRGFFYAGASRLLVSLWNVNYRSTAELMTRFYRGLLEEDLPPPEALRAAQLWMRRQERWRAPCYWASFVLQGEWR